jgi:hypothetical protein
MENPTTDKIDTLSFDVPLFTRVLERVLEDVKDDAQLHELITKIIEIKDRGVLTMKDYADIVPESKPAKTEKEVQEAIAQAYSQIVNSSK